MKDVKSCADIQTNVPKCQGHRRCINELSPDKISYRRMSGQDIQTVIQMRIKQLKDEGAQADFDLTGYLTEFYEKNLKSGLYISWLAVCREQIVGTSGMSFTEKPPYYANPSGKIGILSSMYTKKEFRRKGIAMVLLKKVMDEAENYGCGVVHVTASDMGVLLYSNYGFQKNQNFMQYVFHNEGDIE